MNNVRITERKLTDGSTVTAIKFEATHEDATEVTVTLEWRYRANAAGRTPSASVSRANAARSLIVHLPNCPEYPR